jgi:hypothetical protein
MYLSLEHNHLPDMLIRSPTSLQAAAAAVAAVAGLRAAAAMQAWMTTCRLGWIACASREEVWTSPCPIATQSRFCPTSVFLLPPALFPLLLVLPVIHWPQLHVKGLQPHGWLLGARWRLGCQAAAALLASIIRA